MVKWISHDKDGNLILKAVRLEKDWVTKDMALKVNGLEIAKFTASGDIVVNTEAIAIAKSQN